MKNDTWQSRLLPFVLIAYFLLSLGYGYFFFTEFNNTKAEFVATEAAFAPTPMTDTLKVSDEKSKLDLIKWKDRVSLERNALSSRYRQGRFLVLVRLKLVLLSFALGSISFLIGSIFILARLEEKVSEAKLSGQSVTAQIKSGSPGIILAFLGTVLMIFSIIIRTDIDVTDQPLYVPYALDTGRPSVQPDSTLVNALELKRTRSLKKGTNRKIDSLLNSK